MHCIDCVINPYMCEFSVEAEEMRVERSAKAFENCKPFCAESDIRKMAQQRKTPFTSSRRGKETLFFLCRTKGSTHKRVEAIIEGKRFQIIQYNKILVDIVRTPYSGAFKALCDSSEVSRLFKQLLKLCFWRHFANLQIK